MKYKALILLALSAVAASASAITTTLAYEDQRETNTLAYVETNLIAAVSNNLAAAIDETALLRKYYPLGDVTSLSQITTTGLEYTYDDATHTATLSNGLSATGDVVIPYEVEHNGVMYAVTAIGSGAFYDRGEAIGVSITSLIAPTMVTSIGDYAFDACTSLASVSLPSATSIGDYAFNACTSLASVSLPSATSIGTIAFTYCSSLASVSLPSATSIGTSAFVSCSSLTSVDLGTTPRAISLGAGAFNNVPQSCRILLPMGAYDSAWQSLKTAGYDVRCYADEVKVASDIASATNGLARASDIDYTTGNSTLVSTIEATAPAPGNYAAVSNAAMSARAYTNLTYTAKGLPTNLPSSGDAGGWFLVNGTKFTYDELQGDWLPSGVEDYPFIRYDDSVFSLVISGTGYADFTLASPNYSATVAIDGIEYTITGYIPDTLALASDIASAATAATNYTDAAIAQIDVTETDPIWTADKTEIDSAIESAAGTASQALAYSAATHLYMTANTNSWFEGTNYVFGADATNKTHFTFEEGMDLLTMPCSLALREIRDGTRQVVWDQRDWTAWYWSFKAEQFSNTVARAMLNFETNYMQRGWSKYTARYGIDNPDPDMLWVDCVKGVTLAPGTSWQKFVDIGGAGYWTITGNADICAEVSGEDAFLTIKDFEGNAALTLRKRSAQQVYAPKELNVGFLVDSSQNAIMTLAVTDIQPIAEFSTTLESGTFVEETSDNCPVDAEWYQESNGYYSCHFRLKSGIVSEACFAKFKITLPGEDIVEYTVPITISGGITFEQNGTTYKIKPSVSGTTVTWSLVQ